MTSRPLMTLQVLVAPPQRLGAVSHGTRAIAPITGAFEGPRLRGKVLPGGADWTLLRIRPKSSLHIYLDPDYTGEDEARFRWGKNRQW